MVYIYYIAYMLSTKEGRMKAEMPSSVGNFLAPRRPTDIRVIVGLLYVQIYVLNTPN